MSYGLSCLWQRICNRLDTFATHDEGMEQLDQLLTRQNLAHYLDVSGKSDSKLRDSESLAGYAMTQTRSR